MNLAPSMFGDSCYEEAISSRARHISGRSRIRGPSRLRDYA